MIQILYKCLKICALLILSMCCVSSEWAADNSTLVADSNLQNVEWHEIRDNLIDSNHVPNEALNGVYSECILGLSFACLQRKLIAFLFELDRVKSINLFGNAVMVIRKKNVPVDTAESARIAQYVDQSYLKEVIDHLVDRFFDNHFLRVRIPRYLDDYGAVEAGEELLYLDIDFKTDHLISEREDRRYKLRKRPKKSKSSRKVKKKKFKLKGLKKLMMVIGLMTCLKLAALAPIFLGMIGLKAMKALVFSIMALTIHKMMFLQKFDFSSLLSSGHEGSSGGGHGSGWDRNINEVPPTASTSSLPYYIEPPSPYSSHLASA